MAEPEDLKLPENWVHAEANAREEIDYHRLRSGEELDHVLIDYKTGKIDFTAALDRIKLFLTEEHFGEVAMDQSDLLLKVTNCDNFNNSGFADRPRLVNLKIKNWLP